MKIIEMFSEFWGVIPPVDILIYAILSSIIPLTAYKISGWLHKIGDPPWKNQEDRGNPEK